jgi:hypothetical protein
MGEGVDVKPLDGTDTWESKVGAHLEAHIGRLESGGAVRDGVQVVRYVSSPIAGATAFSSLGLNRHLLASRNAPGGAISMEVVMLARAGGALERATPRLLADIVTHCLDSHCALMRGDLIWLRGSRLEGSSAAALYVSAPAYFPEPFASMSDGYRTCVFAWLVPVTASEAAFVEGSGWTAFETLLAEIDPDLLDDSRDGIA